MTSECRLTVSRRTLDNAGPKAKAAPEQTNQVRQNRRLPMTQANSESHIDASRQARAEALEDAGQRYRFERLALPIVLRDLHFNKDDPGPGDRTPTFDLPTVRGGRFRSADLAETGPALLIFGSSTCPMTDSAAPRAEPAVPPLWRSRALRDGKRT